MGDRTAIVGKVATLTNYDAALFFGREGWEVSITFQPWRESGGEVDSRQLTAVVPLLNRETATQLCKAYGIGSVLEWTPATPIVHDGTGLVAEIFHIAGEIDDTEIAGFVVMPEVFVPYVHDKLGEFTKKNDHSCYDGRAFWTGYEISLSLDAKGNDLPIAAEHAISLIANDAVWRAEFNDRIFTDLHPLWNEVWREGSPHLSRDEWLSRIAINNLVMDVGGAFAVYFDDGDLFWGHSIQLSGNLNEGAIKAQIVG